MRFVVTLIGIGAATGLGGGAMAYQKYPQGLKESRENVYSLAFADAVTMALHKAVSGADYARTAPLSPASPLPPEARLCTAGELASWTRAPNACTVLKPVAVAGCVNGDGCASFAMDRSIWASAHYPLVVRALTAPGEALANGGAPQNRKVRNWQLPGLRLRISESWMLLRCGHGDAIHARHVDYDEAEERLSIHF